jgi:hypothetical protein
MVEIVDGCVLHGVTSEGMAAADSVAMGIAYADDGADEADPDQHTIAILQEDGIMLHFCV